MNITKYLSRPSISTDILQQYFESESQFKEIMDDFGIKNIRHHQSFFGKNPSIQKGGCDFVIIIDNTESDIARTVNDTYYPSRTFGYFNLVMPYQRSLNCIGRRDIGLISTHYTHKIRKIHNITFDKNIKGFLVYNYPSCSDEEEDEEEGEEEEKKEEGEEDEEDETFSDDDELVDNIPKYYWRQAQAIFDELKLRFNQGMIEWKGHMSDDRRLEKITHRIYADAVGVNLWDIWSDYC